MNPKIKSVCTKIWDFPILAYPIFFSKFPFISLIAKASNFKFRKQFGFGKSRHKNPSMRKVDATIGHRSTPKFWVPIIIFSLANTNKFKFGMQLESIKSHHRITIRAKNNHSYALGIIQKF